MSSLVSFGITKVSRIPNEFVALAGAVLLCTAMFGCTDAAVDGRSANSSAAVAPYTGTGPIRAVCTTGMVADMVRHVGGERVAVDQLMGEGIDPHLFKATPDVVRRLSEADVVFYSGLHLEGRMTDVFERMTHRTPTVAVTSTIPAEKLIDVGGGAHDPHVWFDVALWSETAVAVERFLGQLDPAHAKEYSERATAYRRELAQLDDGCRTQLQTIPKERRALVTAHDAFHYFGRAYDVEAKAIQGVSTDTEAGVKEVNNLVEFIADRKIRAVFVETSVSSRNIESLIEGCMSRGHQVLIGGELYSDSMGKPGTSEGTYVGMVRHNVEVIVRALK